MERARVRVAPKTDAALAKYLECQREREKAERRFQRAQQEWHVHSPEYPLLKKHVALTHELKRRKEMLAQEVRAREAFEALGGAEALQQEQQELQALVREKQPSKPALPVDGLGGLKQRLSDVGLATSKGPAGSAWQDRLAALKQRKKPPSQLPALAPPEPAPTTEEPPVTDGSPSADGSPATDEPAAADESPAAEPPTSVSDGLATAADGAAAAGAADAAVVAHDPVDPAAVGDSDACLALCVFQEPADEPAQAPALPASADSELDAARKRLAEIREQLRQDYVRDSRMQKMQERLRELETLLARLELKFTPKSEEEVDAARQAFEEAEALLPQALAAEQQAEQDKNAAVQGVQGYIVTLASLAEGAKGVTFANLTDHLTTSWAVAATDGSTARYWPLHRFRKAAAAAGSRHEAVFEVVRSEDREATPFEVRLSTDQVRRLEEHTPLPEIRRLDLFRAAFSLSGRPRRRPKEPKEPEEPEEPTENLPALPAPEPDGADDGAGFVASASSSSSSDSDDEADPLGLQEDDPEQRNAWSWQWSKIGLSAGLQEFLDGLNGLDRAKQLTQPAGLSRKLKLRDYQLVGFSWLVSNLSNGLGCLLADDMGLGKTVQVITMIVYFRELLLRTSSKHLYEQPALIVAPLSLVQNWQDEIQKWAPSLTSFAYYGKHRFWPRPKDKVDVVVTTYTMLRNDKDYLRAQPKFLMALDEAQTVKNWYSQCSKAAVHVAENTDLRVAISGTPIENKPEELRNLVDFVLPGYLGDRHAFKDMLEEVGTPGMRCAVAPFLLRRQKTDPEVKADLKDKVILRHEIRLTAELEAYYHRVYEYYDSMRAKANDGKTRFNFLACMHGLRKVCGLPGTCDVKVEPPQLTSFAKDAKRAFANLRIPSATRQPMKKASASEVESAFEGLRRQVPKKRATLPALTTKASSGGDTESAMSATKGTDSSQSAKPPSPARAGEPQTPTKAGAGLAQFFKPKSPSGAPALESGSPAKGAPESPAKGGVGLAQFFKPKATGAPALESGSPAKTTARTESVRSPAKSSASEASEAGTPPRGPAPSGSAATPRPSGLGDDRLTRMANLAVLDALETNAGAAACCAGMKRPLGSSQSTTAESASDAESECGAPCEPADAEALSFQPQAGIPKAAKLFELLAGIVGNGEKALVFCQYLETITQLVECCNSYGVGAAALTGELRQEERADLVQRFQHGHELKVIFATIGAGGVGLTLTAATHVIHFDRCYNPAKEAQATDRAHRIGQTRTVTVHLLISTPHTQGEGTRATFEQRIDEILEYKCRMFKDMLESGTAFLADLDDEGIRSLFRLSGPPPDTDGATPRKRGRPPSSKTKRPRA